LRITTGSKSSGITPTRGFWLPRWLGHSLAACLALSIGSAVASDDDIDWAKERQFWSFQRPISPERPKVSNRRWPKQELDYFVLAKLEAEGISPSPTTEKATLLRRVTFDLTGLSPTPQELDAFLKDKRADAYERVVNRLLASSQFGERMASMWLPLARYAEDQAHQVGSDTKFFYPNAYKYRAWVIDAFNRDLRYDEFIRLQLAADKLSANTNDMPALGFIGLGPKYYNRNRLEVMADEWEDRVDTVTRTFLGLTVACARCHDHKFDPITREDYYGLAGVFASSRMVNKKPGGEAPKEDNSEKPADASKMDTSVVHMVEDDKAQDLNVFIRGNVERKGPIAQRQFIRVLATERGVAFTNGSGRVDLAAAIADVNNPLTARVIVNRVWGMFFGKGIVDTPSNFGHSGQPPANQELLDALAVRFMKDGWSIKTLAREIALSAAYQQTSDVNARGTTEDSNNDLLWRMNRRRLSVEQWRDALLFTSGELDLSGGKSLELSDTNNLRRTVYARVSRLELNAFLMQFDYPDANVHAEKRAVTTTAMQKLFALNSPFMLSRAKALGDRVAPLPNDKARVREAYRILFAREPDRSEISLALDFLKKPAAEMPRWQQYAQMLLASNEMLYVD
jgi:hypothetical protein